ncbi:MAG: TonB-dependent receptor, partial [Gammaproteobacteria bacterium]|nr:TonB-dependent receptor [Gammaproteobacteria bacterium]
VGAAQMTDSSGRQLDEIFVVAQKKGRAENLQDVPAAITAYNSEQLDGIVFQKLDDLSYSIPGVQLEQVGTFPGVQNFSIRGQGINSSIPSVDPTVGVFVDGIYQATTYGTVLDPWDLESVEVLRGPQGLLFGRNVTGGAVTVRTARPDVDGEAAFKAKLLATDEDRYSAGLAFEAPFQPGVAAGKIMLYYDNDDGYYENNNATSAIFPTPPFISFDPATGSSPRNGGKLETKIIRPTLVLTPSDTVEMTFIAEHGELEGDGAQWTVVDGNLPSAALGGLPAIVGVRDGGQSEFTTNSNDYGFAEVDWDSLTFELNIDFAGGTLTNIFGWKDVEQASATDVDGTYLPAFVAVGETSQDQWSNELRWASTIGDNWDTTIGIYYLQTDQTYRETRYIQINPLDLSPLPGPSAITLALGGDMDTDTWGIFWNNEFAVTEDLSLLAGIRYSDEEKDADIISGPFGAPPGGGFGPCQDIVNFMCQADDLNGDYDNVTPKLGFRYQWRENAQVYGHWTKGFRAGGFNFRNARPDVIPAGPTKEEEQDSIEFGIKSQIFDDLMRFNVAYFRNEIDDIQRELNLGDTQVVVLQGTINAGDAKIKGVEVEFDALPTDALRVYGSLSYLDGEYTSKNPAFASFLGNELPRLAPWQFSLGSSYDFDLSGNGIIRVQADYGYRQENFYDDANTQEFDAQHRLGASINWYSPEDHWTVSLFGKNLRDEANYGNLTSIAGLFTAGPMQKGREYGLQVQYRSD